MAISEINVSGSFFSELQWVRDTIVAIGEAKLGDRPIGLDPATRQPDALFAAFARRDLLFYPYVRTPGFSLGNAAAYTTNIAIVHYYIERERHEEILSLRARIQDLAAAKAEGRSIGLLAPGGQLDEFAAYFAIRDIAIDVGKRDGPGYDVDIGRLQEYLERVNGANTR